MSDFMTDNPTSTAPGRHTPTDSRPPAVDMFPGSSPTSNPEPAAPITRAANQPVIDGRPAHVARLHDASTTPPAEPARPAGRLDSGRPAEALRNVPVKGRIHIADEVVEKVAALAALEVRGVADLGGDVERAIESVRERIGIGNKRGDQGVKAEIKGQDVRVTVTVMVEYGHVVLDVAQQVQSNVAVKTQGMLGLNVIEVNVTVDDVRTAQSKTDDGADVGQRGSVSR